MKVHHAGEKSQAICETDGRVATTFAYRDVPLSDGSGTVRQILVGVCDRCGAVISIPPQSTPAIRAAREKAEVSIEAVLPAVYLDTLDLACYRIDPEAPREFRKRLLMYYVYRSVGDKSAAKRIAGATGRVGKTNSPRRRLSMRVSPAMSRSLDRLMAATKLNRTELLKSLVAQIEKDIVEPRHPANLKELKTLASIASC